MVIGILTAIGLACALAIFFVYLKVPQKVKGLEKTEKINAILPGLNCGACGYAGCFGYAQAVAKDPDMVLSTPCPTVLQEEERLKELERELGITLDVTGMTKKALVRCTGDSEIVCEYSGIQTCKGASQLLSGYKKCPYACLGLGDCVTVCPQDAISIDPERNIAVVDTTKCNGCGLCVSECPQNIIDLVPGNTKIAFNCSYKPLKNIPGRERCDFGCIHCRKCFKACEYGAIEWNKETALPEFDQEKCTLCLKCVEECPQNTLGDFTKAEKKELERAGV